MSLASAKLLWGQEIDRARGPLKHVQLPAHYCLAYRPSPGKQRNPSTSSHISDSTLVYPLRLLLPEMAARRPTPTPLPQAAASEELPPRPVAAAGSSGGGMQRRLRGASNSGFRAGGGGGISSDGGDWPETAARPARSPKRRKLPAPLLFRWTAAAARSHTSGGDGGVQHERLQRRRWHEQRTPVLHLRLFPISASSSILYSLYSLFSVLKVATSRKKIAT